MTSAMSENQKSAIAEKEKGNEAYKKRDFATAHIHYDKAFELDPTNVTFLTNKAAVFFEEGKLDECIQSCEKAVESGREHHASYASIARAYNRMGNAYLKQEKLKEAVQAFDKSLSENRDKKIMELRSSLQKKIQEQERLAYINPELADQERELGNDCFRKGDYPAAVKHYSEAIKRNPEDAKLYSNRAACYTKLMEFPLAVSDCDQCLKIDQNFIKGYIRKGHAHLAMHEPMRAMVAFEKAVDIDPNSTEAQQGLREASKLCGKEDKTKAAMSDPEVQEILGDPAMRMILEQMQNDPNALKEHLQNPAIANKIMKLLEAGIIGIRSSDK